MRAPREVASATWSARGSHWGRGRTGSCKADFRRPPAWGRRWGSLNPNPCSISWKGDFSAARWMWAIYANHHCGWMQIWFVRNLSFHHYMQPASKTAEKEGEIWGRCSSSGDYTRPTDVFLLCFWQISLLIDQNQQKPLCCGFLGDKSWEPWSPCGGRGAKVSWRRLASSSSSSCSVPTTREKLGAVRGVEMVAGGVEGSSGRVVVQPAALSTVAPWGSQLVDARALPGEGPSPRATS